MSLAFQTFQHGFRMTAISKCRIKSNLPRSDIQTINDLFYHNGNVHSRRCVALTDHMFNGILILLRLKLFIFLLEFLRVFSFITHTSLVRCLCILVHNLSFIIIFSQCTFLSCIHDTMIFFLRKPPETSSCISHFLI